MCQFHGLVPLRKFVKCRLIPCKNEFYRKILLNYPLIIHSEMREMRRVGTGNSTYRQSRMFLQFSLYFKYNFRTFSLGHSPGRRRLQRQPRATIFRPVSRGEVRGPVRPAQLLPEVQARKVRQGDEVCNLWFVKGRMHAAIRRLQERKRGGELID
jgi:hypothetical protein